MAVKDLIKKAQQSKFGKAIGNVVSSLDRDKERSGFQFISPETRQSLQGASQRRSNFGQDLGRGITNTINTADRFAQSVERNPVFGLPSRIVKGVGTGVGYAISNPRETGDIINKRVIQPFNTFSQRLGEAAATPYTNKVFQQSQDQSQRQADLYTKTAIQAQKSGDTERANRFFEAARNELQRATGQADTRTAEMGQKRAETISSGVASANVVAMAYNPGESLINTLVGGAFNQALDPSNKRGFVEGMDNMSKYAGFTNLSNPAISKVASKFTAGANNEIQRQLGARGANAIGNLIEDIALSTLYNEPMSVQQGAASLALGFVMGGPTGSRSRLEKQLVDTGISAKDAKKIAGESVQLRDSKGRYAGKTKSDIFEPARGNPYNQSDFSLQPRAGGRGLELQEIQKRFPNQGGFIGFEAKIEKPDLLKGKEENILTPKQFQNSKINSSKIREQKQKGLTFRGEQPVQGGSKLQVKPNELVKASPSKVSSDVSISRDKKYAFNINKKKLQLDQAQSKQLDNVVEVMRPVLEQNKGKTLTKQEIIEGGRKASLLQDVIGRDESKQFAESLQASRNFLRSEQSQIGITPKFLEQLEIVSSHSADAGRTLQAFNIGAEDITIKEKVLRDILKIGADAKEISEAGKNVDWNDAKQITDFYRKFKPASLADKLDEYRYTNMLSSPNTHINNAFSNFLQTAVLAPIEKTTRGAVSFAESRLTGKEQEYFARQGIDYAKGYWKALPEAIDNFKKTLSGTQGLTKPDVNLLPTSTSKLRQIYTLPLQALEASDQLFRTLVKGGELESLKTEGITGAKASKMAEQAADYRTFRQAFDPDGKLGQNKVLQVWDKWNSAISNLRNVPGGKYLVPFLQTPTNILKQGLEYSPLGFSTVKGSARPTEQLAKAIIGTSVFTGAYALADSGLTTWDTPTNANERAEFYAAGLQPYSIKIGNKWVSYSKLGPLAYPIAMASALKWAKDEGGDEEQLATMGKTMAGTLGFFADQSYVRGIGDIIDAFRGDEYKQARGLSNIPAQLIPYRSAMGWIARQVDPIYRKTSGGTIPQQIGKSLISQIPYASKSLEAYQTPFGEDSQRQFPGINAVSPFSISQERPAELEYYNARNKIRTENKQVDKILKKIEDGKDVSLDTDKVMTSQAISLTKKKIESGIEVTEKELETAYLSKPLSIPSSNRYEKSLRDKELYSSLSTIDNNENLSELQKSVLYDKVASELGKTPEDLKMYSVAKQDNNTKTLFTYDQIDKFQDPQELLNYLTQGRKPINGQILVSDGVIDNLVNDGIIPKELGKQLKNLDINEDGTLKSKKKTSSNGGSKSKKSPESKAIDNYLDNLSNITLPSGKIRTQAPMKINVKGLTFGS